MGRDLRRMVHARYPNAVLGVIVYRDKMWFNAMAAGLSTTHRPVFLGPESTYSGVMNDAFIQYTKGVRRSVKVPCLLVPGVMMGYVGRTMGFVDGKTNGRASSEFLNVLAGNLYQRCQYTEGYWVFAIYRFGDDAEAGKPFFDALGRVNRALDHQTRTGELDPSLQASALPVHISDDLRHYLQMANAMQPVLSRVSSGQGENRPADDTPLRLRGTYTLVLWPGMSSELTVTVRAIKLGNYLDPGRVKVLNHEGRAVWEDNIPLKSV